MSSATTIQVAHAAASDSDAVPVHPCSGAEGANVVRSLFSARGFDFGGVDDSSSVELPVSDEIDVSAFSEAHLAVRLHQGTIAGSSKIDVVVYASAPSDKDPGQIFQIPSDLSPAEHELASIEFSELTVTGTGGVLRTSPINAELGSFVRVAVRGTQGGTVADCNGILSADLVLRRRSHDHISGSRIAVFPRTEFDYSSLAPSGTDSLVMSRGLDVRNFRTGFLALRVHERSIDANGRMEVQIHGALPDPDDPDPNFVEADNSYALSVRDGTTPELHTVRLDPGFGPFLYVRVEALQSPSGGALEASMSLDFVGQE